MTTRTGRITSATAALALTAATVAVAPAHAAPTHVDSTTTTTVQYVAQNSGSAGGSMEDEIVQVGLVLVAGIGVSALLALGAGVAGGAIPVEIPNLPF